MALIKCYHCQNPVSRNATQCQKCGGSLNLMTNSFMTGQGFVDSAGNPAQKTGCAIFLYLGVGMVGLMGLGYTYLT